MDFSKCCREGTYQKGDESSLRARGPRRPHRKLSGPSCEGYRRRKPRPSRTRCGMCAGHQECCCVSAGLTRVRTGDAGGAPEELSSCRPPNGDLMLQNQSEAIEGTYTVYRGVQLRLSLTSHHPQNYSAYSPFTIGYCVFDAVQNPRTRDIHIGPPANLTNVRYADDLMLYANTWYSCWKG